MWYQGLKPDQTSALPPVLSLLPPSSPSSIFFLPRGSLICHFLFYPPTSSFLSCTVTGPPDPCSSLTKAISPSFHGRATSFIRTTSGNSKIQDSPIKKNLAIQRISWPTDKDTALSTSSNSKERSCLPHRLSPKQLSPWPRLIGDQEKTRVPLVVTALPSVCLQIPGACEDPT